MKYAFGGAALLAAAIAIGAYGHGTITKRKTAGAIATVADPTPVIDQEVPTPPPKAAGNSSPDARKYLDILDRETDDEARWTAVIRALISGGPEVADRVRRRDPEFIAALGEPALPIERSRLHLDQEFAISLGESRDPSERRAGAMLLSVHDTAGARARLLSISKEDPDEDVRTVAARALAILGDR